jgi:hypothetical protein
MFLLVVSKLMSRTLKSRGTRYISSPSLLLLPQILDLAGGRMILEVTSMVSRCVISRHTTFRLGTDLAG